MASCSDADRTPHILDIVESLLKGGAKDFGKTKGKGKRSKAKGKVGASASVRPFTSAVLVATYPCSEGGQLHIASACLAGSAELPKDDLRRLVKRLRQIADEIEEKTDALPGPVIFA